MSCCLILPTTLFDISELKNVPDLKDIIIYEEPKYFTDFNFHKLKLIFHRATMKAYEAKLKSKRKYNVLYIPFNKDIKKYLPKKKNSIYMFDPTDFELNRKYSKLKVNILPTPGFILNKDDIKSYLDSTAKPYANATFYKWIRNQKQILMTTTGSKSKPIGGSYSYDIHNRQKFKITYKEPKIKYYKNKFISEAKKYVNNNFPNNPEPLDPKFLDKLFLPIDHKGAQTHFKQFLKSKLKNFGNYEDAIRSDVKIGYHSCISALINIGLLNPMTIVKTVENVYLRSSKSKELLYSVEGFIRQVLSWREYVRMLYLLEHAKFNKLNFFKHTKTIGKKWYDGTTNIKPIDVTILKAKEMSYLHHIERLMVIGNFMLLTEIKPKEAYKWFMSMVTIDAYEWVMEPNIYGMALHSVGKLMMGRPYFSSSSYIKNMSDYKGSESEITFKIDKQDVKIRWDYIWDSLFYNFIKNNKEYLSKIYSTANFVAFYNKKNKVELKKMLFIAKTFLKKYI